MNKYELTVPRICKTVASLTAAGLGVVAIHYRPLVFPAICFISSYATVDSFFVERDMAFHHLLVISFISAMKLYDLTDEYKTYVTIQLLHSEYSTIFLSSRPLILHILSRQNVPFLVKYIPKISIAFHAAFIITFVKFRIYNFAANVVFNKNMYVWEQFSSSYAAIHIILTIWSFYALNLYWLQLILLKLIPTKFVK